MDFPWFARGFLASKMLTGVVKKIASMIRPLNNLRLKACQMNLAVPSSVTEIPREIREQEREIESILRSLILSGQIDSVQRSQHCATKTREQKVAAWISIAVLGLTGIVGFCLLWIYGTSGC